MDRIGLKRLVKYFDRSYLTPL